MRTSRSNASSGGGGPPRSAPLGRGVHALTSVAPDSRRRHVHDVRVPLNAAPEERRRRRPLRVRLQQRAHLLEGALARPELGDGESRQLPEHGLRNERLVRGRPEDSAELAPRGRDRPEVARRDDVQRPALEQRLDEPPTRQRPGELVALEALEPRPERQVRARRGLRLQAAEPLDRLHGRQAVPLEQELSLEQGAVQLAPREDPLGRRHPATLPAGKIRAAAKRGCCVPPTQGAPMSWFWILVIVLLVLLVLGYFGRGRFRA